MATGLSRGSLFMLASAASPSSLEASVRGHSEVDEIQYSRRTRGVHTIRGAGREHESRAALGRRQNAAAATAKRAHETAPLRIDKRRLFVWASSTTGDAAPQLETPANRCEQREARSGKLGPCDRRRRARSVESIQQIDEHVPAARLGRARGKDMPSPAQRDRGRIEGIEITRDGFA